MPSLWSKEENGGRKQKNRVRNVRPFVRCVYGKAKEVYRQRGGREDSTTQHKEEG